MKLICPIISMVMTGGYYKFLVEQSISNRRLLRSEAVFRGSHRNLERVSDMSISRSLTVLFDQNRSDHLGLGVSFVLLAKCSIPRAVLHSLSGEIEFPVERHRRSSLASFIMSSLKWPLSSSCEWE